MNRSEVWTRAYCAALTLQPVGLARDHADTALREFDQRFRAPSQNQSPNPRFVVDGHLTSHIDSDWSGDGQFAPFAVFHPDSQDYVPGIYPTREQAQRVADFLNQLRGGGSDRQDSATARSDQRPPTEHEIETVADDLLFGRIDLHTLIQGYLASLR